MHVPSRLEFWQDSMATHKLTDKSVTLRCLLRVTHNGTTIQTSYFQILNLCAISPSMCHFLLLDWNLKEKKKITFQEN